MAGANHPEADPADDGYLTAAEITGINLQGTELVTLSACQSGAGAVQSGEGVYGLQRALTVAGARSMLLSLWPVDDGATRDFMGSFYRRLVAGASRADALGATQAEFRAHSNPLYRDLYVWAAFQLVGDWREVSLP
jgi:CHAT domain-containing protein